ncbi:MAG: TonB-dependent receptor, partial [candidate division KSB1 bacterium]|nr:TonB-dependent receptor [candidate division KSB1 bacterium]
LPQVDISLSGTSLKTTTDSQGKYFLLNIPPGTYIVQAKLLGYVPAQVKDIQINSDLTTVVDFKLSSTVIEIDEIESRLAPTPLIYKDATASTAVIAFSELNQAPVETFKEMVYSQAGISVDRDMELHFRGSRADEVVYLVDGLPDLEPSTARLSLDIPNPAIQQLSIIDGAFNAEYDPALSGVVNILTKPTPDYYTGALSFQTGDVVTNHSRQFSNEIKTIDFLNTQKIEASLGGPVPGLKVRQVHFFTVGRYLEDQGYLYGIKLHRPTDASDGVQTGDRSVVSMDPFKSFDLLSKLSWHPKPDMKLQYSGLFKNQKWQSYNSEEDHRRKFVPEGRLWYYDRGNRQSLTLTHQVSNRMFYHLAFSYYWNKYWYQAYSDARDPRYVWAGYARADSLGEFLTGGTQNERLVRNSITLSGKFDLTRQFGYNHEVKAGLEFKRHDLYQHDYTLLVDRPDKDDNNDGIIGNIIEGTGPLNNQYRHHPVEFSTYLQDKVEWTNMIINVGLRFDYFHPDGEVATNWKDPDTSDTKPATAKMQLSPRFSLAFLISDKGKLFFSYGHFFQLPPYQALYANPDFDVRYEIYKTEVGNADLEPQKTVSYELGLEQELTNDWAISIKGYYRDMRNLLGRSLYVLPGGQISYVLLENRDFGHVKGAMVSLNKRFSHFFSATLDYRYQLARGNESQPLSNQNQQGASPGQVTYLDWDQPHSFRMNLNLGNPGNWGLGMLGRIESGYPYTRNSGRTIPRLNFDLRAYKAFSIPLRGRKTQFTLFLKIYNLFDRLNENYVWESSGRSGYLIPEIEGQHTDEWINRPYWYTRPRQIFAGLSFEF